MKPTLTVLCGLPGVGKSTYAEKLNATIVSTDAIRKELGDVNDQSKNEQVFSIAHKRIRNELKNGNDVIFDAYNISRKSRRGVLHSVQGIDCFKRCVVVYQPVEECKRRNSKRERKVPEEVIDRMLRGFDTPAKFEGFDEIDITDDFESKYYLLDFIKYKDMDQENSHHKLSLGEHQKKAADYLIDKVDNYFLTYVAQIHDCGKPMTKKYDENKQEYRYFNHHNVGAYLSLGYYFPFDINSIDVSLLVNLHMQPYFWQYTDYPELTAQKYKSKWGEELFNQVMLLHEADVYAH